MTDMPWAKLPRWIVLDGTIARLTPTEIKTLMILVTLTDQHGFASPSHGIIAELGAMDKRAVRRSIRSLRSHRIIEESEPASGRRPAQYLLNPSRREGTKTLSTDSVERAPKPCLPREGTKTLSTKPSLRAVDRAPKPSLRTHIGTHGEEERRERENISLSSLPDYAVDLFCNTFPRGLIKTNWSEPSFDALRKQLDAQPMTTRWQVDRCMGKLLGVQGRKFPVPNPAEVYEAFRAIEAANKIRSKFFERVVKNTLTTENLAEYRGITEGMGSDQISELFERTHTHAKSVAPEAANHIWDSSVPSLQRNAYSDLLIDPECNQFAARGLRCWVIQAHHATQKSVMA